MDHDSLYKYFDRHKYTYDRQNRPCYQAQRITTAINYPDISVKDDSIVGTLGEWILKSTQSQDSNDVILFFHGGSFVRGNKSTDRAFCRELVLNSKYDVYSTDYALAPEHPFPQGLEDSFKVYKELCRRLEKKGLSSSNLVLCGESSGATMALAVANYAKKEGISLPKALVLLSPCVQFTHEYPSQIENLKTDCMLTNYIDEAVSEYFQTRDITLLESPLASPLYGDFTGFPPVFVMASDSEVLRDHSIALYNKMKDQGVDCTLDMAHGLMHVYPIIVGLEESKIAVKKICRFIDTL